MQIVKVSPKGQITIPKMARKKICSDRFVFEMHGKSITLKPIKVVVEENDLTDFSNLAKASFEFWDNEKDDVYQEFYGK